MVPGEYHCAHIARCSLKKTLCRTPKKRKEIGTGLRLQRYYKIFQHSCRGSKSILRECSAASTTETYFICVRPSVWPSGMFIVPFVDRRQSASQEAAEQDARGATRGLPECWMLTTLRLA